MHPLFQVHMLNDVGIGKANDLASAFDELLKSLRTICPENCREFSLVKTHLELASFYSKKAMAQLPENQKS